MCNVECALKKFVITWVTINMDEIKIRFACLSDAEKITESHLFSSSKQPGGFMFRMGRRFLCQYWRLILLEKNSVILCAEDQNGEFLGFVSGTIDAEERAITLRNNKIKLLLAALPSIMRSPRLLGEIFSRQKLKSADSDEEAYIVQSGPREDFWAWLPNRKGAIEIHLKWLSIMRTLGVKSVRGEVDKVNDFVVKTHRMLGARIIKEFVTPDGKERQIIEYSLNK